MNISVIILLVNFKLNFAFMKSWNDELFGFIPILNGDYNDFTVQWY